MAAHIRTVLVDNLGKQFDPVSLPHQYFYDANGNLEMDQTVEAGSIIRQKTFTYVQMNGVWLIETESGWVNVTQSNVD